MVIISGVPIFRIFTVVSITGVDEIMLGVSDLFVR